MRLILYSKPGCHLCEGLQEKLEQVRNLPLELEIRDITSRQDWFQKYEYEIPVLCLVTRPPAEPADHAVGQGYLETEVPLPRLSPRSGVAQLEQMLQKYLPADPAQ